MGAAGEGAAVGAGDWILGEFHDLVKGCVVDMGHVDENAELIHLFDGLAAEGCQALACSAKAVAVLGSAVAEVAVGSLQCERPTSLAVGQSDGSNAQAVDEAEDVRIVG